MVPVRLQLHNFLSYREPAPLDFENFNLAVLSGNNGVGKSSILEAITWAIWGQTRANSDDEIIFQGTNNCWVELIFIHEGSLYRILRKRDKKNKSGISLLEFQVSKKKSITLLGDNSWESIAEGTIKATQEKIVKILKIPYDIFTNSSYLRQGRADEFTIKAPAERKQILSNILDLDYYEALAFKAREKARELNEKIKLIDFQIDDAQIQIAGKKDLALNIGKIKIEYDRVTKQLNHLKRELIRLELANKEFELAFQRRQILLERYQEIQINLKSQEIEMADLQKDQKTILEKITHKNQIIYGFKRLQKLEKEDLFENENFKTYSEVGQKLNIINHDKNELDQKISRINKISKCPTCMRPMNPQESLKIISLLKKEFDNNNKLKIIKLKNELSKINYDPVKHKLIQKEIANLLRYKDEKQALDLAENNLLHLKKNIIKNQNISLKLSQEIKKITQEGMILKTKMTKLEKSQSDWQEKKSQEEKLTEMILDVHSRLKILSEELIQIERLEQELKNLNHQKLDFQKQISQYEELSLAFGKKGIQAMIIEQSLATIEENANHLLKKITDNRMTLKFVTQKEKKSAKSEEDIIETLEINIADELGQRNYEMYSGGEAFRINFAIRIALSKLLASRIGTHLKFLAIDEGFGMLDSAGRDDLVAAINSISSDFEKILVITHLQELKDLFPTKIEITKDDSGSHLEVINT